MTAARQPRSLLPCVLVACLALPASLTRAQETRPLPSPGSSPWQPQHFPKVERHTEYEVIQAPPGEASLRSQSDCSASGLVLPLVDVDWSVTPRLSWRWRIHRGLTIDDERSRSGDDFAARVYVLFEYDADRVSFRQRAARMIARLLYGRTLPGAAISYVWASRTPLGERWTSPFSETTHMIALRSHSDAQHGEAWSHEEVDLMADSRALFGDPVPRIAAIALMTDTDNSCSQASAEFSDFRLGPRH